MKTGAVIAGFRVERTLGRGSFGTLFEATQISLDRPVALRVIPAEAFANDAELESFDERQRRAAALHHPSLIPGYAAGEWEGGRFVASRLIRGTNLKEPVPFGGFPGPEQFDLLTEALALVHSTGLDFGGLKPEDVLVDDSGGAYLAEAGLRRAGGKAAQAADRQALGRLRAGSPGPKGRGRLLAVTIVVFCGLVTSLVVFASRGKEELRLAPAPPPGTRSLGVLHAADDAVVGCSDPVSPNTPACTLEQLKIGDSPLKAERPGVIRSWSASGASGELALQVIRRHRRDFFVAGFSQPVVSGGGETITEPSDLGVRAGDRIAVRLGPGASIGIEPGSGARFRRWDGGLTPDLQGGHGTPLEGALQLRADVDYGAPPEGPGQLTGEAAGEAPAGDVLREIAIARGERGSARVKLVELPRRIVLDVFDGRRVARLAVPDADPAGQPAELVSNCGGGSRGFCLRWQNPGTESSLFHAYRLEGGGRLRQVG